MATGSQPNTDRTPGALAHLPWALTLALGIAFAASYIHLQSRTQSVVIEVARLEQAKAHLQSSLIKAQYDFAASVTRVYPGLEYSAIRKMFFAYTMDPAIPQVVAMPAAADVAALRAQRDQLSVEVRRLSEIHAIEQRYADTLFAEFNSRYGSSTPMNLCVTFVLGCVSSIAATALWQRLRDYVKAGRKRTQQRSG